MINALIIISALVFAVISHEFGHMLMTKICGVSVPEFGIGFGKRLGSFTVRGTRYQVGLIPLGGYVKIDDEAFFKLPAYKKNLVFLAGPFVNIGSAALLMWMYWMSVGINMGKALDTLVIKAGEASLTVLGILLQATAEAVQTMGADALMGPVGAVGVAAQISDQTGLYMTLMVVMLFLSLGIVNLLPLPALDGGQVLMTVLRVPVAIHQKAAQAGLYAMLVLGVVIMGWDVYRIITGTLGVIN